MSAQGKPDPDVVALKIGGRSLSGWTSVRIERGIEQIPNVFELEMTELYPDDMNAIVIQPGDVCQVFIGPDLVITGYVNRFIISITAGEHKITVSGRSKSQDLVDCSAQWPGGQIAVSSAFEIATKLSAPYGITVTAKVDTGTPIPRFPLNYGETAYAIIERIARSRGLLIYDLPDGSITLAQAGTDKMASGVAQGGNVEAATAYYTDDQRYAVYDVFPMSMNILNDLSDAGFLKKEIPDSGARKGRNLDIISEGSEHGLPTAIQRGQWEAARRAGRAYRLEVTVDNWRDEKGEIWSPNKQLPVSIPALKVPSYDWLIGHVTYVKDATGTHALMEIMPRAAFLAEPILLVRLAPDITAAVPPK